MTTAEQQPRRRGRQQPSSVATAEEAAAAGGSSGNSSSDSSRPRLMKSSRTLLPLLPRPLLLVALLVLGAGPYLAGAFKYKIDDKYAETAKWSFTETYMYGSGKVCRFG